MSERRDIAEDLVDVALTMRVGREAPRDLTEAVLNRHRERQQGDPDMNLPEIVSTVSPFGGQRTWNWTVNAAAVLVLTSVSWMLFGVEHEAPHWDDPEAASAAEDVKPTEVETLADIERLEPDTRSVVARGSDIDDEAVRRLCALLPNLSLLTLYDTEVTDAGLAPLRSLRSLRTLMLDHSRRLTDVGLDTVATLETLRHLSVAGWVGQTAAGPEEPAADYVDPYSKFTSEGLAKIARLQRLEALDLRGTNIEDDALIHILENGSAKLVALKLGFTAVTDRSLRVMASQDRVVDLDITNAGRLYRNDSLKIVADIDSVRFLAIGGNNMQAARYSSEGIRHLMRMPLTKLAVQSCPDLGRGNGWGFVTRIASLRDLSVRSCKNFGDDDLAILCRDLKRLRRLDLGTTRELTPERVVEIIAGSSVTDLSAPMILDEDTLRRMWQDIPRLEALRLPDGSTLTR